jgi:hypothetical protein
MLALDDEGLAIVMDAARPLQPSLRDAFLRAVALALRDEKVIGPGVIARTCASLQREFFTAPTRDKAPWHG